MSTENNPSKNPNRVNQIGKKPNGFIRRLLERFLHKNVESQPLINTPINIPEEELPIENAPIILPTASKGSERFNPSMVDLHRGHTLDELKGKVRITTIATLDAYFTSRDLNQSNFFEDIMERYLVRGESLNRIYHSIPIDLSAPTFNKLVRALGADTLGRGSASKRYAAIRRNKKEVVIATEEPQAQGSKDTRVSPIFTPKKVTEAENKLQPVADRESLEKPQGEIQAKLPKVRKLSPMKEGVGIETEKSAIAAIETWDEINTRRADAGQNITLEDYRYFSDTVGIIIYESFRIALTWSQSPDQQKRQYGERLLFSQALRPIIDNVDALNADFQSPKIEYEDLVQEMIVKAFERFRGLTSRSNIKVTMTRIGEDTYKTGAKLLNREEAVDISSVTQKEVDKVEIIEGYIRHDCPFKETEISYLQDLFDQLIPALQPREQRIIKARYELDNTPFATLATIAAREGVKGSRIGQLEQRALRKLRRNLKSNRGLIADIEREIEDPKEREKEREKERIRVYWNTVINAVHEEDKKRAVGAIARLKADNAYWRDDDGVKSQIIKMLTDPRYPNISDEIIDKYLQRFTNSYQLIRERLRELEKGDGFLSNEVRRMEETVKRIKK